MTTATPYAVGETVEYRIRGVWRTGRIIDTFTGTLTGEPVYVIGTSLEGEIGFYADELRPIESAPVAA